MSPLPPCRISDIFCARFTGFLEYFPLLTYFRAVLPSDVPEDEAVVEPAVKELAPDVTGVVRCAVLAALSI